MGGQHNPEHGVEVGTASTSVRPDANWLSMRNAPACRAGPLSHQEGTMPQSAHDRAAELHNLAAHAHAAAATAHGKADYLTAHELTKQAHEHSIQAHQVAEELSRQGRARPLNE